MVEEFFVDGKETLAILLIHILVGEQQHQIKFWPTEKFEFLSTIGDDMVEGMTRQLELISIAIRNGWMVGLGVATNHRKEKERKKKEQENAKNKPNHENKNWIKKQRLSCNKFLGDKKPLKEGEIITTPRL